MYEPSASRARAFHRSFKSFAPLAVALAGLSGCQASAEPAGAVPGAGGATTQAPGSSGVGGATAPASSTVPCDVGAIVQSKCAVCHAPPLNFGVPMTLLGAADFQKPAKSDPGRSVASVALERIDSDTKPMPPPPNARLDPAEIATLSSWLQAGAPSGGATGCNIMAPATPAPNPTATTAPTSTSVPPVPSSTTTPSPSGTTTAPSPTSTATAPPVATGAAPTATTAPTGAPPVTTPPEQTNCYDFTSHGGSTPGDTSPFSIPVGESYHCFYFDVPWGATEVATAFRSKLDNTKGLHHWFLYAMPTSHPDGSSESCLPLHFDGPETIAGWSPGAHDIVMPSDVGAEIPKPMTTLMVEWHYLNSTSAPLQDQSSVTVCTVPASSRPKLASIAWVGTENLTLPPSTETSASGTCKPGRKGMNPTDPIQLMYAAPHMHQYGTHFNITIQHADGTSTAAMDQPFDVSNQAMVDTPYQMLPGDTLKTTCTFRNTTASTIGWGDPFTGGEMCYGIVVHYPAHSLDNGTRTLLGASNSCL